MPKRLVKSDFDLTERNKEKNMANPILVPARRAAYAQ